MFAPLIGQVADAQTKLALNLSTKKNVKKFPEFFLMFKKKYFQPIKPRDTLDSDMKIKNMPTAQRGPDGTPVI